MSAGVKIRIEMTPTQKLKLKHLLNEGGKGQQYFTHTVRRLCDPYVPFDKGNLKNTAEEAVDHITYVQPYASKQYYTNRGAGKQGVTKRNSHNVHCLRGAKWDARMWADRGDEVIEAVAKYVGGHKK